METLSEVVRQIVGPVIGLLPKAATLALRRIRKGEASRLQVGVFSWHVTVEEGEQGRKLDALVQVQLENPHQQGRRERVTGASLSIRRRFWRFRRTVLEVPLRTFHGPHLRDLAIDPLAARIGLGLVPSPSRAKGLPRLPRNGVAVLVLHMAEPIRRLEVPLGDISAGDT